MRDQGPKTFCHTKVLKRALRVPCCSVCGQKKSKLHIMQFARKGYKCCRVKVH